MKKNKSLFIILIFLAIFIVQPNNFNAIKSGLTQNDIPNQLNIADSAEEKNSDSNLNPTLKNDDLKSKEYDGKNQVIVVNEKSQFTKSELSLENGSWEKYSDLDFLNRVGIAEAMLGKELMPTEDRDITKDDFDVQDLESIHSRLDPTQHELMARINDVIQEDVARGQTIKHSH